MVNFLEWLMFVDFCRKENGAKAFYTNGSTLVLGSTLIHKPISFL